MNADRKKAAGPARAAGARPLRRASASKPRRGASDPGEHADFLARAWAMELEAVERYSMFADAMEEHNNRDVAELFRKLARIEQIHADQLSEEARAMRLPLPAGGVMLWEGGEGPESADPGELHYRMQPYHALEIALLAEHRAEKFFRAYARTATLPKVREAALEMAREEAEHVRLIEEWLARTPRPDRDWEHDSDPPVLSD